METKEQLIIKKINKLKDAENESYKEQIGNLDKHIKNWKKSKTTNDKLHYLAMISARASERSLAWFENYKLILRE